MVAKWWRDEPAHVPVSGTDDDGVRLIQFAMALRKLHDALLDGADARHIEKVRAILRDTQPMRPGVVGPPSDPG